MATRKQATAKEDTMSSGSKKVKLSLEDRSHVLSWMNMQQHKENKYFNIAEKNIKAWMSHPSKELLDYIQTKHDEEAREKRVQMMAENFCSDIVPFGWLDIKHAVSVYNDTGLSTRDFIDDLQEFQDSTGTNILDQENTFDINYVAYDSMLQRARNHINEVLDFDILNDTKHQIEVYSNFMCTSFDYKQEAIDEITEKLSQVDEEDLKRIFDDKVTSWVLNEVDITLKSVREWQDSEKSIKGESQE